LPERKPCGTPAAYRRHKYVGEPTCQECRTAYAEYERNRRNAGQLVVHGLQPGGIPFRALDKLQIDGGWLTCDGLADELGVKWRTMQRALYRLHEKGMVETRRVPLTWTVGRVSERIEWRAVALPEHWEVAS
jgi:hypothetical protein